LRGKSGGLIAGTGIETFTLPTSFTVSGTEHEIRFDYSNGGVDDFKYVRLDGVGLWLAYTSYPYSGGYLFQRP